MQVVRFEEKLNCPIVVCLGYFGCMHLGHVELVRIAKQRAAETGAKVALFTFSNNHLAVLGRENSVIYTFDERLTIYANLGIDYVIAAEFDGNFCKQTSRDFVSALAKYDLNGVVCGFDYSFGSDRADSDSLRSELAGICSVDVVQPICRNGEKISTTLVRKLLREHDIAAVNTLLSENYFAVGLVEGGRHVGSRLGFPTANIAVNSGKFLPLGVYGAKTVLDGKQYRAIVNIGQKPTFGISAVNVEAHLLDFDGNLYGKTLKLSFDRYLRPIYCFEDANELAVQLQKDKEAVLND